MNSVILGGMIFCRSRCKNESITAIEVLGNKATIKPCHRHSIENTGPKIATIIFLKLTQPLLIDKSHVARKCLLVDDDEDDKEIFCLALRRVDPSAACLTASDGLEALSILLDRSFLPDYIFLDLNMPKMDGKECLEKIRNQKHLDRIPVIIFSTSSSDKEEEETRRLGANSFIIKPPLISTLAENIQAIFNNNGQT